jgi:hypothetical protein
MTVQGQGAINAEHHFFPYPLRRKYTLFIPLSLDTRYSGVNEPHIPFRVSSSILIHLVLQTSVCDCDTPYASILSLPLNSEDCYCVYRNPYDGQFPMEAYNIYWQFDRLQCAPAWNDNNLRSFYCVHLQLLSFLIVLLVCSLLL